MLAPSQPPYRLLSAGRSVREPVAIETMALGHWEISNEACLWIIDSAVGKIWQATDLFRSLCELLRNRAIGIG